MSGVTPPPRIVIPNWVRHALGVIIVAVVVAVLYLAFVVAGRGLPDAASDLGQTLFGKSDTNASGLRYAPAAGKEFWAANTQHLRLAAAVGKCMKPPIEIVDWHSPVEIRQALLIGLMASGDYWRNPPQPAEAVPAVVQQNAMLWERPAERAAAPVLTPFQLAVIQLSDATTRARMTAAVQAADSSAQTERFQLWAVVLGATTTILVGIRAVLQGQGFFTNLVGVSAICVSALSTAFASMNSFYGPNELKVRSERAVAHLREVHLEMSIAAMSRVDLCAPGQTLAIPEGTDPYSKIVIEWMAKLPLSEPQRQGQQNAQGIAGSAPGTGGGQSSPPSQPR